jgi:DNA-binding NarL/FixJ family response regulator
MLMMINALQSLPDTQDESVLSKRIPSRPLSPREKQILDLINNGRTQKEAAFELGLSPATVRVLYSRAMAKLGRTKRAVARPAE